MEIITATTDLMIVPEEKISLSAGVRLRPGVILTIGYGQNDDKDAPYRAVTLELDGDGPEASILVAFREPPPLKLFEGVAIGLPVFNENVQGDGEDDTEDDTIEDLLHDRFVKWKREHGGIFAPKVPTQPDSCEKAS